MRFPALKPILTGGGWHGLDLPSSALKLANDPAFRLGLSMEMVIEEDDDSDTSADLTDDGLEVEGDATPLQISRAHVMALEAHQYGTELAQLTDADLNQQFMLAFPSPPSMKPVNDEGHIHGNTRRKLNAIIAAAAQQKYGYRPEASGDMRAANIRAIKHMVADVNLLHVEIDPETVEKHVRAAFSDLSRRQSAKA